LPIDSSQDLSRRSTITHRASWAAGAAMALTLGAFALAGPAAASAKASTVNTVIATIPLPGSAEPEFTVVDPVRGVVWTADPYNAYEISEHTNTVIRTIALTHYPDAMTVDPATGNVLLASTDGTLSILHPGTGKISDTTGIGTSTIDFARGVAVDPANGLIYVTLNSLESVSTPGFANSLITVLSERTGKILKEIADPNESDAVAINPLTHLVYVTNSNPGATFDEGSSVWVISERTNHVIDTITEPSGYPESIAIDPLSGKLFIPNIYDGPLTVINTRTDKVTAEITLGTDVEPYPLAVDPANGTVYVDNYGGTQVYVVSEKTNKLVGTITVPVTYGGISVDPLRGVAYQSSDLVAGGGATSTVEEIKLAR